LPFIQLFHAIFSRRICCLSKKLEKLQLTHFYYFVARCLKVWALVIALDLSKTLISSYLNHGVYVYIVNDTLYDLNPLAFFVFLALVLSSIPPVPSMETPADDNGGHNNGNDKKEEDLMKAYEAVELEKKNAIYWDFHSLPSHRPSQP
jgi:hypothetical protein